MPLSEVLARVKVASQKNIKKAEIDWNSIARNVGGGAGIGAGIGGGASLISDLFSNDTEKKPLRKALRNALLGGGMGAAAGGVASALPYINFNNMGTELPSATLGESAVAAGEYAAGKGKELFDAVTGLVGDAAKDPETRNAVAQKIIDNRVPLGAGAVATGADSLQRRVRPIGAKHYENLADVDPHLETNLKGLGLDSDAINQIKGRYADEKNLSLIVRHNTPADLKNKWKPNRWAGRGDKATALNPQVLDPILAEQAIRSGKVDIPKLIDAFESAPLQPVLRPEDLVRLDQLKLQGDRVNPKEVLDFVQDVIGRTKPKGSTRQLVEFQDILDAMNPQPGKVPPLDDVLKQLSKSESALRKSVRSPRTWKRRFGTFGAGGALAWLIQSLLGGTVNAAMASGGNSQQPTVK